VLGNSILGSTARPPASGLRGLPSPTSSNGPQSRLRAMLSPSSNLHHHEKHDNAAVLGGFVVCDKLFVIQELKINT
jgi:hypothetical protein